MAAGTITTTTTIATNGNSCTRQLAKTVGVETRTAAAARTCQRQLLAKYTYRSTEASTLWRQVCLAKKNRKLTPCLHCAKKKKILLCCNRSGSSYLPLTLPLCILLLVYAMKFRISTLWRDKKFAVFFIYFLVLLPYHIGKSAK